MIIFIDGQYYKAYKCKRPSFRDYAGRNWQRPYGLSMVFHDSGYFLTQAIMDVVRSDYGYFHPLLLAADENGEEAYWTKDELFYDDWYKFNFEHGLILHSDEKRCIFGYWRGKKCTQGKWHTWAEERVKAYPDWSTRPESEVRYLKQVDTYREVIDARN